MIEQVKLTKRMKEAKWITVAETFELFKGKVPYVLGMTTGGLVIFEYKGHYMSTSTWIVMPSKLWHSKLFLTREENVALIQDQLAWLLDERTIALDNFARCLKEQGNLRRFNK